MLNLLTLNIGAASRDRAERLLDWLTDRDDDVIVVTETSAGPGTAFLLDQFRAAGYEVVHTPDRTGERGTALISQIPVTEDLSRWFTTVSIPGRVAAALLATDPAVAVLGVYVPSRDRSAPKVEKKHTFVRSLLASIDSLPGRVRAHLVIGGDYNVIARSHQPLHTGFLPFEFDLLESLTGHGFIDAHQRCAPDTQAYSWIGRTGDGYRYDYFHVGPDLGEHIAGCEYLHDTREQRLTDHAAVTLELATTVSRRLPTTMSRRQDATTLF